MYLRLIKVNHEKPLTISNMLKPECIFMIFSMLFSPHSRFAFFFYRKAFVVIKSNQLLRSRETPHFTEISYNVSTCLVGLQEITGDV